MEFLIAYLTGVCIASAIEYNKINKKTNEILDKIDENTFITKETLESSDELKNNLDRLIELKSLNNKK